jgi:hypothetical protein
MDLIFFGVLNETLRRICEEFHAEDLGLLSKCLLEEIPNCIKIVARTEAAPVASVQGNGSCLRMEDGLNLSCLKYVPNGVDGTSKYLLHLNCPLSFIVAILQIDNGRKFPDYTLLFEVVGLLIQNFIVAIDSLMVKNTYLCQVVENILQLMFTILGIPWVSNDISKLSDVSMQWGCVFEIKSRSLFDFS